MTLLPHLPGEAGTIGLWSAVALFIYLHAFFVMVLTGYGLGTARARRWRSALWLGVRGGVVLAVVIAVALGAYVLSIRVAPGLDRGLPWITILWAGLTASLAPARIAAWLWRVRLSLAPPLVRLMLMLPWLLVIWGTGLPAQRCTGECWGLMEGGIVMVPLLGLHLFIASVSTALLSAAGTRTDPVPDAATG
ncbi:hypothetical protein K9B35_10305 [Sphingomonas sp. R647]|uniref:hypothetical protein n=1 Tax=Sphingomonas sp. R647 TaxID=2875233 RepID=UPI001CD36A74|nr:hypothetical protein [Sphingomonas sp. R647]MCA1198360.1 hypothetical protein [Sphingomonas sp. R647]